MSVHFGHPSFLLVITQLLRISAGSRASVSSRTLSYEQFRVLHRTHEIEDDATYATREALFQHRAKEVAAHNSRNMSWTMTLNRFADFTPGEMQARLGYKRVGGRWEESAGGAPSLLQTSEVEHIDMRSLDKEVDWRSKMNHSNFVHDQGACGSCWAHAAVSALEAHAEMSIGHNKQLATQEIIDCSPNPRHCGGTGGCHGATAEIAFELARSRGISLQSEYTGKKGSCPAARPDALKVNSFVRLPENRESNLMWALAKRGPVVMSVDAKDLFMYHNGVFAGCKADAIVNHAVLGVGYGSDAKTGMDYWLIKNSWGNKWGENGYFRIQRFNKDYAHCGTDNKPQDGVYCDKHPATIRVCGMCGATSDSAYPVFHPKTSLRQAGQRKLSDVIKTGARDLFGAFRQAGQRKLSDVSKTDLFGVF